jgi:hypothetical protein
MARLRITVAQMGTPDWPRYAVRDNKGRYWTGRWWSDDPRDALLYQYEHEAANEATVMNDCIEPRRFVARVSISVEHDAPLTTAMVRELLRQATVSLILPDQHELADVDIEIVLDWQGLRELE